MTAFPAALDTYTPATPSDTLAQMMGGTHHESHNAVMAAIVAIQTKLGIAGSADTASIDYLIHHLQGLITPAAHINAVSNTITSTGINVALPTNFNLISGVLGVANGLNDANTAQNQLGVAYMALAVITIDLVNKFNTLVAGLQAQGLEA